MDDLISRQAAIDTLKMDYTIIPYAKARDYVKATLDEIWDRLDKLPSAVPERPKGKWKFRSNPDYGINPEDAYCSKCDYRIDTTCVDFDDYKFCPNCGADMMEEEDDCNKDHA